ncbi:MAG: ATP phosphoribosyltransferase [Actinobacteria bacterium]|nr:ATP phosphoribosyltransferase [Actinomycetota bacterium]
MKSAYSRNDDSFDLSIALPKGYLFDTCINVLNEAGYQTGGLFEDTRKLFTVSPKDRLRYVISRPMDVPVYVENGACDIGFSGKDVLAELESDVLELLDLRNGKCRVITAAHVSCINKVKEKYEHFGSIKIATKYPNIAKKYFDNKGMQVEIIKLHGSLELAPVLGIADEILDITATGKTIEENNLIELEEVLISTTRLISNTIAYRLKFNRINYFVNNIKSVVSESGKK